MYLFSCTNTVTLLKMANSYTYTRAIWIPPTATATLGVNIINQFTIEDCIAS